VDCEFRRVRSEWRKTDGLMSPLKQAQGKLGVPNPMLQHSMTGLIREGKFFRKGVLGIRQPFRARPDIQAEDGVFLGNGGHTSNVNSARISIPGSPKNTGGQANPTPPNRRWRKSQPCKSGESLWARQIKQSDAGPHLNAVPYFDKTLCNRDQYGYPQGGGRRKEI